MTTESETGSAGDPLVVYARAPRWLRRGEFTALAERISRDVASGRRYCCRITGDAELRRLNRDFLGKDEPTDVLSFPAAGAGEGLGDIAISAERAAAQAERFGHAPQQELAILLLHGVLHLLGYDHEQDGGRMKKVEAKYRRQLGLPAGLIERARH